MVIFSIFFVVGVWLLQQQAKLPDFIWAWVLCAIPILLMIPTQTLVLRITHTMLIATFACGLGFYHAAWQAEQRLAITLPEQWQGRDIEVIGVVAAVPPRSRVRGPSISTFSIAATMASCAARPAVPPWSMKSSISAADQIIATGLAMFLP